MIKLDQVRGGAISLEQAEALVAELSPLGVRHVARLTIGESYLPLALADLMVALSKHDGARLPSALLYLFRRIPGFNARGRWGYRLKFFNHSGYGTSGVTKKLLGRKMTSGDEKQNFSGGRCGGFGSALSTCAVAEL
jgi:hypothetical protein